jgi:hypothetical protein
MTAVTDTKATVGSDIFYAVRAVVIRIQGEVIGATKLPL